MRLQPLRARRAQVDRVLLRGQAVQCQPHAAPVRPLPPEGPRGGWGDGDGHHARLQDVVVRLARNLHIATRSAAPVETL